MLLSSFIQHFCKSHMNCNADHNGIHVQCTWKPTAKHNCENHAKGRVVWCYSQADWERASTLIDSFDWNSLLSEDVNESWSRWCQQFLSIMKQCIPRRTLPKRKNLPWLSKRLVNSIKKRNLLYKRGKRSGNLSKYKSMRNKVTRELHRAKLKFFQKINPRNPKEFWRAIKYLNKQQSSIPSLVDEDGNKAATGAQKADMLNKFFSRCFNSRCAPLEELSDNTFLPEAELLCNEDSICELLLSLDVSKSNGPDGISARMLKCTAVSIAPAVTQLFNLSIRLGRVPNSWKLSSIVPIPKSSSKPHSLDNYRPISLLSVLSKVLEKHIHALIVRHLEEHYPLSDSQWGFRTGRSTVSALLLTVHKWLQLLESGKDICAVFLDYRKAFDSVPHAPLITKLQEIGLNANLLAWLTDYLTLRRQQVVVDGITSDQVVVTSGVPQGSVLGPLLFSIYINDITEVTLSPQSHSVLYADDALLYRAISQPEDFLAVQSDIKAIEDWSDKQLLQLNPKKCKFMIISRKWQAVVNNLTLYLGGTTLEEVETFKYLGILLSSNLSWSEHISGVCSRAKQVLGLLYRQFYRNSSSATLKQLYLTLVRPHLEYASQLWDPHTQNDMDKLEAVQKFALKLVSHRWDAGYEELLGLVNVPRLSERRLHLKLAQVYKIIHGLCYFPKGIFEMHTSHSDRLARADTLHCPFARTNYFFHSFVPSSIRAWNTIDESQACAVSLHSFKQSLRT